MRTVTEIKKEMTDAFMANASIKAKYDPSSTWTSTTTFEDVFASSSLESIFFYIVAVLAYGLEYLMGAHEQEVANMEDRMRVGYKEWWRQLCFNFQFGDNLVFDNVANTYGYATIDETKKVIKYCDVREVFNGLSILINTADINGDPAEPDQNVKDAFDLYLRKTKIAGIRTTWNSYKPDDLTITLTVAYNPLVCDSTGALYSDGSNPVETAISNYLANIPYGSGQLNKTALIDAVQLAEGVDDVYFTTADWLKVSTAYVPTYTPVYTQNLRAYGGSFKEDVITINYVANV